MGKLILIVCTALLVSIVGIGAYLSPDDLRGCDQSPAATGNCSAADAIVAVSGGNTRLRAAEAIELYQNGWGDYLIFSGAAKDTTGPSNAEEMRRQALMAGVPASDIIIDAAAQTTQQNALGTSEIVASNNITRMIVVTSPYHQRRATIEFQNIIGPNVAILSHPVPDDPDWPPLWWLTPRGLWLAGGEVAKIVYTQLEHSRG